jgi:hypothetical protein
MAGRELSAASDATEMDGRVSEASRDRERESGGAGAAALYDALSLGSASGRPAS